MLREDKEKDSGKRKVMVNRDAYSICNRTLCRNDNRYLPCVNLQKITYDSLPSGRLLYLFCIENHFLRIILMPAKYIFHCLSAINMARTSPIPRQTWIDYQNVFHIYTFMRVHDAMIVQLYSFLFHKRIGNGICTKRCNHWMTIER